MWPGTGNKCKKCKAAGSQVRAQHSRVWAACHRHSWLEASLTNEARNARSVVEGCRRERGAQEGAWGSQAKSCVELTTCCAQEVR